MVLEDAEEEIESQDYQEAMEDLQEQIRSVETDFKQVKTEDASGDLAKKQQKAENVLSDIHDQIEFLQEQVERMNEENQNR
ncbi:MAG: hypothetical protein J07AB43_05160 [Candidatus Nanosalina sp. J07AB43]|jgi:hypothetical protein|nr:MAG: hypothetical protein J07AB43_05160 [Candidatus Nanosalina sp. J07AB43]